MQIIAPSKVKLSFLQIAILQIFLVGKNLY
jgi:hypothetical protein